MASFGSAESFLELKNLQVNPEETMAFLYPMIQQECLSIAKNGHRFPNGNHIYFNIPMDPAEVRKSPEMYSKAIDPYCNEALLYLCESYDGKESRLNTFLNNEQNDPDHNSDEPRDSWFRNRIADAMVRFDKSKAVVKGVKTYDTVSLNAPLVGKDGDEDESEMDRLPSPQPTAEERMSDASPVIQAVKALFSLKNRTDTLMTVVYAIVRKTLFPGEQYDDFVAQMNGRAVNELAQELDRFCAGAEVRLNVTEIIRGSGREKDLNVRIFGLTARKLAVNKNDVLEALKKKTSLKKLLNEDGMN